MAQSLGLPWGISESAYNARDLEFTYQYSNFGVPDLGLKRGLSEGRVIAPYAAALAAMVDPAAAVANLKRITEEGGSGSHGYYEALDYTPSRVPEGAKVAVVKAFMAHHQGMTIVAIADTLFNGQMRARFHAEPIIQATELLLQERMPRDVSVAKPWAAEVKTGARLAGRGACGRPPLLLGGPGGAAHAASLQRPLHHHADDGRFGLQYLGKDRPHALARRCNL